MSVKTKYEIKDLTVKRDNPLVRLPAKLFKNIDKRKKKIPIAVSFNEDTAIFYIDTGKLNA